MQHSRHQNHVITNK